MDEFSSAVNPEAQNADVRASAARARLVWPAAIAALAAAVFLIAFWPRHGLKGHARKAHASHRSAFDERPGADQGPDQSRGENGDAKHGTEGNTPVTSGSRASNGGSPIGGSDRRSGAKSSEGDRWWYQEGKPGKSEASAGGSESPIGGPSGTDNAAAPDKPARTKAQKASSKSGPDDNWWRE